MNGDLNTSSKPGTWEALDIDHLTIVANSSQDHDAHFTDGEIEAHSMNSLKVTQLVRGRFGFPIISFASGT